WTAAETGPTGGEVACRARSSRGTALSGFDDKSLPPAFAAREESGVASRVPGTRSRILCWSRPQSNSSKTAKGFLPCCLAVCSMLVSTAWARAPRGLQPRTIEEGKEVGSLVIEMVPEPAVGRIPARVVQHAIELDFQTSRRGQQSVQGDLLVLVALGQGQGLLEHLLHPQREACGASRGARDQFLRAVE